MARSEFGKSGDLQMGAEVVVTERFQLLERIGKGGMGVVWKAHDTETGETVALKLLYEQYADDPDYVARFEREVDVARRIESPNVVHVLGYGQRDGIPFIAMEYIEGRSLREHLKERRQFTWEDACTVIAQVFHGLAAAHAQGVLHRDIKPSNILLTNEGQVKIVDFGIARAADLTRLTGGSTMLGTPTYMAPEGQEDVRSELYSVGVLLYELMAGEPPFAGESMHTIIAKHLRQPPDLSRVPAPSRPVLARLLEKDPASRPATAEAAVEALSVSKPARAGVAWQGGALVIPLPGLGPPAAVGFSSDSETFAVAYLDGQLLQWAVGTGQKLDTPPSMARVGQLVTFAPGGGVIACATREGAVRTWRVPSLVELGVLPGNSETPLGLALADNGLAALCGRTRLRVWDALTGRVLRDVEPRSPLRSVQLTADGRFVGGVRDDGSAVLWLVDGWDARPPLPAERTPTTKILLSPDGSVVATAHAEMGVLLRRADGSPWARLALSVGDVAGVAMAFALNGRQFACGSRDAIVLVDVWDGGAGNARELPLSIDRGLGSLSLLRFSPNGAMLAAVMAGSVALYRLP